MNLGNGISLILLRLSASSLNTFCGLEVSTFNTLSNTHRIMKTCLAIILTLVAVACAQHGRNVDPRTAAILAEARYLSGDGSFGSAYVQEDGTDFKEETDADGTRKGQYSYLDPQGKKITVSYTAGKNGFQVSGDHLPRSPAPLPVQPQQQAAPVPQYNPAPRYNTIPQNNFNNFNTFNQYNPNSPQDTPEVAQAKAEHFRAYSDALARSSVNSNSQNNNNDDGQYREEYNQPQQQYNNYQQQPQPQQYSHYQQPQYAPIQVTTTTPTPSRFFPPGKLNLNRTPDGFQYSFNSQ